MRRDLLGAVLAAVAACSMASPLVAQSLAREIERAPDGWVLFQYALERDVEICRNGSMRRGDSWRIRWSDDRDDSCTRGVAQAELRVRDGVVTDVEIQPPSRGGRRAGSSTDLGERDAQEVADYFLTLAKESSRDVAEDAILPAVIARGAVVWPDLIDLARDRSRPADVREQAVFWVGQQAADAATDGRDDLLADDDEDVDVREAAVFAISQRPTHEAVPVLMEVAETSRFQKVRRSAVFWLGQTGDSRALDFFERILTGTGIR